jgi:lysozyme
MILGTDISHWQDSPETPKEIDFNKMKSAGAQFVFFKASQAKWTDKVFASSWANAKGIMPRGAYHYLDWSSPGVEQAKYFCDVIANDPPEIPPVVDFEERKNVPANANGQLWNFVTYVEGVTRRIPMIYTSPAYWKEFGSPNSGWRKYPLWIANYYANLPAIPKPWNSWVFWQFTPKGMGSIFGVESIGIDLDYFNGTYDQLLAFCNIKKPEPTSDEKLQILWREAASHGWHLE